LGQNYQALQKAFLKIAKDFPEIGNKLLDMHYGIEIAKITDENYLNFAKEFLYNLLAEPENLHMLKTKLFKLLKIIGRIELPNVTDAYKASLIVSKKLIEIVVNNEYAKLEDEYKEMESTAGATREYGADSIPDLKDSEIIGYTLGNLVKALIEMYITKTEVETSAINLTAIRVELDKLIRALLIEPKKPNLPGFSKETYWLDSIAEILAEQGMKYAAREEDELKELLKERFSLKTESEDVLEDLIHLIKIKSAVKVIHHEISPFDQKGDRKARESITLTDDVLEKIVQNVGKDKKIHDKRISELALYLYKKGYNAENISFPMMNLIHAIARK